MLGLGTGTVQLQRAWRVRLLLFKCIIQGSFPCRCTNQPRQAHCHWGSTDEGSRNQVSQWTTSSPSINMSSWASSRVAGWWDSLVSPLCPYQGSKTPHAVLLYDQLLHPLRVWLHDHTDLPQAKEPSWLNTIKQQWVTQNIRASCGKPYPFQKPAMARCFISDHWHHDEPSTCSQLTPDEGTTAASIPTHLDLAMATTSSLQPCSNEKGSSILLWRQYLLYGGCRNNVVPGPPSPPQIRDLGDLMAQGQRWKNTETPTLS